MNRHFNFRAWNGEEMKYDFIVGRPQFVNALSIMDNEKYAQNKYNVKEWKVMQFTGLKDKNGKDIYESDIVKHKNGIQEVIWDNDSLSYQMSLSNFVMDQEDPSDYSEVEVIGNIYENPNLIK